MIAHRPREALRHCLAALAAQAGPPFEVVLVDDSPDGLELSPAIPAGLPLRVVSTGGRGAAAARNAGSQAARGDLLLFLDDDLVPRAGLIGRHLARHRDEGPDAVVIGYSPPRPSRPTLAAQAASIWWEDHFRAKREMAAPTFVEMLSGNMSIRRELFDRLGGFDESFGRFRREDWELGVRALQGGARLAYEHDAVAEHHFDLDAPGRLAAAHAEGRGDALLMERYPFARLSLAVSWSPPPPEPAGSPGLQGARRRADAPARGRGPRRARGSQAAPALGACVQPRPARVLRARAAGGRGARPRATARRARSRRSSWMRPSRCRPRWSSPRRCDPWWAGGSPGAM